MGEVLQLVTKPEQTNADIKELFADLNERLNSEDPDKKLTFKKACILLLDDEENSVTVDHYDFTMITANLSTSEVVGLLEIAKHKAFDLTENG